ncbi:AMP-binding protein [Streptomyces sp. MS1.AVA.1]|uniref:AMP-binding protein n=1 Tax=Streptomyces machairae TaxID=3134109 RepID=A0ABU8UX20_9ACTN
MLNLYGPAEAAIWSTWHECSDDDDPPIGRPVPGKRVYALDDDRRLLPVGCPGELYIGGAGVGRYLGRPERMADSFVPDVFADEPGRLLYRTGDVCVWRADGSWSTWAVATGRSRSEGSGWSWTKWSASWKGRQGWAHASSRNATVG